VHGICVGMGSAAVPGDSVRLSTLDAYPCNQRSPLADLSALFATRPFILSERVMAHGHFRRSMRLLRPGAAPDCSHSHAADCSLAASSLRARKAREPAPQQPELHLVLAGGLAEGRHSTACVTDQPSAAQKQQPAGCCAGGGGRYRHGRDQHHLRHARAQ